MTRTSPVPRLHLIGPMVGVVTPDDYLSVAAAAVAGGCDAIHVRMPGEPARTVAAFARVLRSRIGSAALIVNDRIDVALAVGADGVHLGEGSLDVADARAQLPPNALIGRSIHDLDGARCAEADGVDYLLAGHIFETGSKAGQPGRGLAWLSAIADSVAAPVIAIGGITVEGIPEVLTCGAWGVAMGRELVHAGDAAEAARRAMLAIEQFDNSKDEKERHECRSIQAQGLSRCS